jgi:arsenate reductase-like glutaredoxin family protein
MMETDRIQQAVENALIKTIQSGDLFKMPYDSKIDVGPELRKAYALIDYKKVYARITSLLEEELAQKIVNKIVTEMGTDIKNLMCNATVRDDFRFLLRKGVEEIMEKVKNEPQTVKHPFEGHTT